MVEMKKQKWVAYDEDMKKVVAIGDSPQGAADNARKVGVKNPVIDILNEDRCSFIL